MSPRPKIGQAPTPANTRSRANSRNSQSTSTSTGSSPEVSTCSSSTSNQNTVEDPAVPSTSRASSNPSFSKVTKGKAPTRNSTRSPPSRNANRSFSPNAATGASRAMATPSTSNVRDSPSTSDVQASPSTSTSRACTRTPVKNQLTDSSIYKIVSKICSNENTPPRLLTHSFVRYVLDEMHLLVSLENSSKKVRLMNQIAYDLAEYVSRIDKPRTDRGVVTEDEADCHQTNYHLNLTLMELRDIDSSIHELATRKIGIYNRLDANLFGRPPPPCMGEMPPYIPEEMDACCPKPGPSGVPVLNLPHTFSLEPMQIPIVSVQQQVEMVPPPQPVTALPPSMQMISQPVVKLPAPIPVPPPPPVPVPPPPPPPVPPPPPQNSNQYFDGNVVDAAARSSCFVVPVKREINITEGNPEDITVSKISDIRSQNLISLKNAVLCSCRNGKIYKFLSKKNSMDNNPHKMSKFHICAGPIAAMLVWNNTLIVATVSGLIKKCSLVMGFKVLKTFDVGEQIVCMAEIQGILYVSTKPSYLHIINLRSLTRLKDTVETGHLVKVLKNTFYNEEEILVCLNDKGEITGSAIHEGIIGSVVFKFTLPGVKIFDVYIKRMGPPRITFFCGSLQNASCLHLEHGVFSQGRMVKLASSAMVTYKHLNFLGSHHGDIMIVNITTMETYVYTSVVKENIVSLLYIPKFLYIATDSGIFCLHLRNQDHFLRAAAAH